MGRLWSVLESTELEKVERGEKVGRNCRAENVKTLTARTQQPPLLHADASDAT